MCHGILVKKDLDYWPEVHLKVGAIIQLYIQKTNYILNINSNLYHISDGGSEIPDTLSYIFSSITWLTDSVQLVLKPSKGLDVGSILFTY